MARDTEKKPYFEVIDSRKALDRRQEEIDLTITADAVKAAIIKVDGAKREYERVQKRLSKKGRDAKWEEAASRKAVQLHDRLTKPPTPPQTRQVPKKKETAPGFLDSEAAIDDPTTHTEVPDREDYVRNPAIADATAAGEEFPREDTLAWVNFAISLLLANAPANQPKSSSTTAQAGSTHTIEFCDGGVDLRTDKGYSETVKYRVVILEKRRLVERTEDEKLQMSDVVFAHLTWGGGGGGQKPELWKTGGLFPLAVSHAPPGGRPAAAPPPPPISRALEYRRRTPDKESFSILVLYAAQWYFRFLRFEIPKRVLDEFADCGDLRYLVRDKEANIKAFHSDWLDMFKEDGEDRDTLTIILNEIARKGLSGQLI
ncbi:hypothetical protein F4680DRAFT_463379 [Xylaria scruposa]|nr:hypothetical protein F4680DRAFT_463379 [Xylaria scruposa]